MRYLVREPIRGEVIAHHVREDTAEGKRMWWELPDGRIGLHGIRTADLPLYGAAAAHRWSTDHPVIVTEGEKAASALVRAGWQAAGTVTGAAGCPNREALMVLAGMEVILWPDADEPGRRHMQAVAAAIDDPGHIVSHPLRLIDWRDAPPEGDAADAIAAEVDVGVLFAAAGPVPPMPGIMPMQPPAWTPTGSPIARFNAEVSVSEVLASRWHALNAAAGRTVRCPAHDDRLPSLSVARDDRRAWCHVPSCQLYGVDGRGVDAWDLWQLAESAA